MDSIVFENVNLAQKINVYLDSIPKVLSQEGTAVSIQPLPQAIAVELKANSGPLEADYKAYFTTFPKELEFISTIDEYVRLGQDHIRMLYCYRSVSQAIPEISIEITDDMTNEEKSELSAKKNEINQKIFDILRPEMGKIKEFLNYTLDAVDCFYTCVSYVSYKDQHKEMIPEGFYLSLIQLLDVLMKLDNLKDFKSGLRKDFARYKRAIGTHPSVEVLEELTKLQNFLAGQDARKARNYILQTLRDEIKRINDHETLLIDCLDIAMTYLDEITYVLPEEKFCFLRVIPYLIVLLDGEVEDSKASNIFKNGKIKIPNIQKLLKKNPVVPLYGDMTLTLEVVLQRAPHYEKATAIAWGAEPEAKVIESYDICHYWETVRSSHAQYLIKFSAAVNRYQRYEFKKILDEVTVEMAKDVYDLVLEGLQKLSRWVMILRQMLAWKYTHPISKEKLIATTASTSSKDDVNHTAATTNQTEAAINQVLERDGLEYGLVLRHNLSKQELSVISDFIYLIKSLASQLLKQESLFAPFLRFHIHHSIQQLVQGDLLPLLHRVDKRNKPILPTLLKLRSLAADWMNGIEPATDYKEYTRKQGSVQCLSHTPRVVGPAITQLFILRTQVASLCESKSEVRRKESIFGKADLEKADIAIFQQFYDDSFFYPYILNYSQHVREIADVSDLWYREFFLELTKCVQFPIDLSLPWMLIEHVLNPEEQESATNTTPHAGTNNHHSHTMKKNHFFLENVFYLFDIYNDAANRSLYQLNSQFLYDEIEAEANLVIDQFYFLLSDEIYHYYKNLSASIILEKSFQLRYEEMKHQGGMSSGSNANSFQVTGASRYHHILSQKTIQLLGRSINLSLIFTQNITGKFHRDIDIAIKKFESYDVRGIVEFRNLLFILKMTHELMSQYLLLDGFDQMLQEIDESWSTTAYRGRISLHILTSIARDIIPNFCYNQYTQRFIPAPIPVRPWEYNKAPKQTILQECYGNICYKAFESQSRLVRPFFGMVHIQAMLSLESVLSHHPTTAAATTATNVHLTPKNSHYGITQLTMIIDQLVKNLYDKMMDLSEYLTALKDSIPPCKPPQSLFGSIGAYGYYEGKLKTLLEFDDLKPEVFQIFREIGNTLAFMKDISNVLELQDGLSAHFLSALFPTAISSLVPNTTITNPNTATTGTTSSNSNLMMETQSQISTNAGEEIVEQSPVTKIIQSLQKTLLVSNNTNLGKTSNNHPYHQPGGMMSSQYEVMKDLTTIQLLPQNIERQLQYYSNQFNLQATNTTTTTNPATNPGNTNRNGKNLMKWLCIQLEEFLYQQNFTTEWSAFSEENLEVLSMLTNTDREAVVIEIENNPSFSKMWSALCFLFCIVESDTNHPNDTSINDNESDVYSHTESQVGGGGTGGATGGNEKQLTNFAEFGHGFLMAGSLFLHLLGQRPLFELLDYTNQVLRMVDYENEMNESVLVRQQTNTLDFSLVKEYKSFLIEARKVLQMNYEWMSYFQSIYTIRPSYSKYAMNRNTFHPPSPPTLSWQ